MYQYINQVIQTNNYPTYLNVALYNCTNISTLKKFCHHTLECLVYCTSSKQNQIISWIVGQWMSWYWICSFLYILRKVRRTEQNCLFYIYKLQGCKCIELFLVFLPIVRGFYNRHVLKCMFSFGNWDFFLQHWSGFQASMVLLFCLGQICYENNIFKNIEICIKRLFEISRNTSF